VVYSRAGKRSRWKIRQSQWSFPVLVLILEIYQESDPRLDMIWLKKNCTCCYVAWCTWPNNVHQPYGHHFFVPIYLVAPNWGKCSTNCYSLLQVKLHPHSISSEPVLLGWKTTELLNSSEIVWCDMFVSEICQAQCSIKIKKTKRC
jgi:hypothetical protein